MDSPTLKLSRNSSVLLDRPVTSGTLRAGSLIFDLRRNSSSMLPPLPSITESARAKRKYKKVYPNKVYTPWYRRYVNHLPDGQRIDFQPGKEIRKIDEDIALQFFYGEDTPLLEERLTKECAERRLAALRRYTKIMEMRERASREKPENKKIEKNISLRSIIAANKSKQPDLKEEFGFNATEKKIISPILTFIQKLQVIKGRQLRGESRLPASSKWHLFQTPIMKTKLKNLILSTKHAAIRARFRRVINLVRCVYRFIHIISVISGDTKLIMKSVAQFTQEQLKNTSLKFGNQNRDGKGKMMFNAAKYKLSKRLPFSMEVKLTLTKPWFDRSDNEVTEVVKTLQVLRSFVEFPKSSQRRLAQVAWLIEVPADRVIIRECHISQDFYILLRGKAKMTKLNGSPFVDEKGEHTLIRWLKRDTIFGEESMSQPLSEREYTVYSTDHCDVLAVNINDYLDMLMKTRDDEEAPEHIAFISTLDFLRDFPRIKLLEEGCENITIYYFTAGMLVAKSVQDAQYMYVVKYGTAFVISEKIPPPEMVERYNELMEKKKLKQKHGSKQTSQDRIPTRTLSSVIPTEILQALNITRTRRKSSIKDDAVSWREQFFAAPWIKKKVEEYNARNALLQAKMNESLLEESMEIHKKSMKMAARVKLPGISLPEPFEVPPTGLKTRMSEDSVSRSVSFQVENPLDPRRRSTLSGKGGPSKSSSKNFIVGSHLDFSDTVSKILTCQDDDGEEVENKQDKEEQRHSDESIVSSAPQQPVHQTYTGPIEYSQWKLIKRLVKGDYIGHEWLDFNNGVYEPPKEDWSIVSEGCEMIMIKKEFLLKYLRRDW